MGQHQSSALGSCLTDICAGRPNCVSFSDSDLLYQIDWVKPYNLDIGVSPAAVIRPETADEVSSVIKCATANNVKVQAKSGGHSFANFALPDAGITIDMVNFQEFSMDNTTWDVTIGAGSKLGDVDDRLKNTNRTFAHGVCPDVGLGGHATIGGLGPMSRMWGSALDHIMEVEVVTADGNIVRASDDQNSDLFYALRGAGAGFGVITEFVMRTHPAPESVVQYSYAFSFNQSTFSSTYKAWQDLVADPSLDRRFGTELVVYQLGTIITGTFYGTQQEFDNTGILQRLPPGGNGTVVVTDWAGSLTHWAEHEGLYLSGISTPFYSKSLGLRQQDVLSDEGVATVFDFVNAADKGTLLWFIIFDATGGAIADVTPANATAYAHRDKVMFYQSYVIDPLGLSQKSRDFLTDFHSTLLGALPATLSARTHSGTTYPGYVDEALTEGTAQQGYWGSNLTILEDVKLKWDSNDVFHNPQSVRIPAGTSL